MWQTSQSDCAEQRAGSGLPSTFSGYAMLIALLLVDCV